MNEFYGVRKFSTQPLTYIHIYIITVLIKLENCKCYDVNTYVCISNILDHHASYVVSLFVMAYSSLTSGLLPQKCQPNLHLRQLKYILTTYTHDGIYWSEVAFTKSF